MKNKWIQTVGILLFIVPAMIGCNSSGKQEQEQSLKIVYNVLIDEEVDDYEIFTMNPDGTGQSNISQSPGVDWSYYAFKDRIFFVSDRDTAHRNYFLWEMKGDGSQKRKISNLRLADCFMSTRKNGTEIIVLPHSSIDSVFYILNMDGEIVQKVDPGMPYIADPYFSPDGNRIVFRGALKNSKREEGFIDELYLLNLEGGEPTKLTRYPEEDTTAEWWAYRAGPPVWEPNRNAITYTSKQNGHYGIFLIDPSEGDSRLLTPPGFDAIYHDWSPDGSLLVLDGTGNTDGNYDIYLMEAGQGTLLRLTSDSLYQGGPVFVTVPD